MHELYELKDMLCKELKEYGEKGELTPGTLDVVDKLAHAMKNLDKVIEAYEEEDGYSSRSYPDGMGGSYRRGYSREGGYSRDGRSYARGRGSNAQRDSRGRYSGNGYSMADGMDELLSEMRDMLPGLPEDKRRKAERLLNEMER